MKTGIGKYYDDANNLLESEKRNLCMHWGVNVGNFTDYYRTKRTDVAVTLNTLMSAHAELSAIGSLKIANIIEYAMRIVLKDAIYDFIEIEVKKR